MRPHAGWGANPPGQREGFGGVARRWTRLHLVGEEGSIGGGQGVCTPLCLG